MRTTQLISASPRVLDDLSGDDCRQGKEIGSSAGRRIRPVASLGVPRYQLAGDVVAYAIGAVVVGDRAWLVGLAAVIHVVGAATTGLYRSRLTVSILREAPRLMARLIVAGGTVAAATSIVGARLPDRWWPTMLLVAALILIQRATLYGLVRLVRSRRLVNHRTLIVGAGIVGSEVNHVLQMHPEYGLKPVAFFDTTHGVREPSLVSDAEAQKLEALPILGRGERYQPALTLSESIRAVEANVVIIAFSSLDESSLVELVRTCSHQRAEIFAVPRLFELHSIEGSDVEDIWGIPLHRFRRATHRSSSWIIKRAMDVIISAVALIVLAPLLLALAIGVRRYIGGSVLFQQRRVGIDGREFTILKFRSLPPTPAQESDTEWSGSARSTSRFGRFMRGTSLDELPQFWNVLRGDMSLVGPRPERPHFVETFSPQYQGYDDRHRVPAGLTGLAQVNGLRGDTPLQERTRFDNVYVERWSLMADLEIMVRTLQAVFKRSGQ